MAKTMLLITISCLFLSSIAVASEDVLQNDKIENANEGYIEKELANLSSDELDEILAEGIQETSDSWIITKDVLKKLAQLGQKINLYEDRIAIRRSKWNTIQMQIMGIAWLIGIGVAISIPTFLCIKYRKKIANLKFE